MAAPTAAQLRTLVDLALADDEVTDAEIDSAIDEAILSVRGDMLIAATVAAPAAAQTVTVPAGFVYIYRITIADEEIPDHAWYLMDSDVPKIVFNKAFFGGAPSGTINITGGKFQERLSGAGSLFIDPGYVAARALATLHASRGGTASDLADWHKQEHARWAAISEQRKVEGVRLYGPTPTARLVKGYLTT